MLTLVAHPRPERRKRLAKTWMVEKSPTMTDMSRLASSYRRRLLA